jgi:DNA-binding transcriptional LysR family regulator
VSDDVVDLQAQRVDVAVRIGVLQDSDLLATTLAPQRRVVVASPRYLARAGRPQAPLDLLQHNCLTHAGPGHRVGWWTFHGVNDGKPLHVAGSLRSGDTDSLMRAALAGVGVAHLATWLVGNAVAAGRLVLLFDSELRDPPVSGSAIHAVRVAGRSVRKSKLFVEHLKRELGVAGNEPPLWERHFAAALRR